MKDKKFLKVISAVLFFMIVLQIISLLLSRTNTKESWSLTKKEDVSVKEELPEEADAGNADQQEPVLDENAPVLRIFDKNMNNVAFDDDVAKEIMRRTGIRIEIVNATSAPNETLEMMMVKGDYPDIILMEQGEMVNRFIEDEAFIPLDTLIREKGQNISSMYGDILDKSRYTDGKIYWLANWYGKDTDASAGVLMRKDYLIEMVGEERANSTEPFTLSEYTELLREFKRRHEKVNGMPSIPLELDEDLKSYENVRNGIFGLKTYEIDEDNRLHYLPATEVYKNVLMYMNQLSQEGLLGKEWMIDKHERWEAELKKGTVFSTWAAYWDTDDVNKELKRKLGKNSQFYCYKVVADHLDETETTYNGRNSLGWDAIGITRSCQDTDAAMKLLNFLASEEGQYLLLWGVEGETWDLIDGVHVPKRKLMDLWAWGSAGVESTKGVRRWKWTIKNGNGSDGTPYDVTTKYIPSEFMKFANERISESDYWDTAEFIGLEPSARSELGLQWQKIEKLYNDSYLQIICAPSEEEAEQIYERMLSDMKLTGLEECERYVTTQYRKRMIRWG